MARHRCDPLRNHRLPIKSICVFPACIDLSMDWLTISYTHTHTHTTTTSSSSSGNRWWAWLSRLTQIDPDRYASVISGVLQPICQNDRLSDFLSDYSVTWVTKMATNYGYIYTYTYTYIYIYSIFETIKTNHYIINRII